MNRTSLHARRVIAAIALAAALTRPAIGAHQPRPISETDLLQFNWAADPQISPDGTQVVFTRVSISEPKDDYESSVWIVPVSGSSAPRRLTAGPRDSAPRWAPDGRRLAFLRSVDRDGRPQPAQLYLLALSGGEAYPITEVARGAAAPVWSPDGTRIAFSSTTRADDTASAPATGTGGARKSDVRVITSAAYRFNGAGWGDPDRPAHLWVVDIDPPEAATEGGKTIKSARQITTGKYSEGGHIWSSDSRRLLFTSTRVDDAYYLQPDSNVYAVPAAGGDIVEIASINGTSDNLSLSPDGQTLAFVGTLGTTPARSYSQSDLFTVSLATPKAAPLNLTADYDFDVDGGVGGDQAPPRGGSTRRPVWSADGRSITLIAGEQGDANLVRLNVATRAREHALKGSHTVQSFTASNDKQVLVALVSTQTNIGDLFVVESTAAANGARPAPRQITRINDDLFKQIKLSEPTEVWWTSFDGKKIQGWLLHPPDFDRTKKYPFILEIHGGPHSAYGNVFTHEFHWLAAKGYVVLYPNPRGSSNYGQEFGNIIQYRYPGDDYKDLMAGVDEVLKRGYIDEKRLGVTGGSGGGLLTNWTITQTDRFAAAVSQRSIADWSGFWYTADFTLFTPFWFPKAPWEDPAHYAARSPITHVAKVKTPLMLIDGDDDLRTPPSDGGEIMFRALKYLKVPTVMVRFPAETHELSRSGKPRHRIERLQHIAGWFDKYLQGQARLYETAH